MPERGVTPGSLLIDRFLPRYDLSVVHASVLPARPEDCYRAARQLDLFRDPIIRTLLGLRSLPNRLADRLGNRLEPGPPVRRRYAQTGLPSTARLLSSKT